MATCPECGIDTYRAKEFDRLMSEKCELGSRFKQLRANHALEIARWEIRDIENTESMKWLQRKTRNQAAAIRKLEEKLKKLGKQPYEETE